MTRRTEIIAAATEKSDAVLAGNSHESATIRLTLMEINQVCKDFVESVPPRNVTAASVCVELAARVNPGRKPTKVSTIYNNKETYGEIVRIWKSAYDELRAIRVKKMQSPVKQLAEAAFEHMDPGTANMVRLLQASLNEQIQINNELQQFITEHIPITSLGEIATQLDVLDGIEDWIDWMVGRGFTIDNEAIKVSARTGIGTPIIPIGLFNSIKNAVQRFKGAGALNQRKSHR